MRNEDYGPTAADLEADPAFLNQKELLAMLGITRQRFYQLQNEHGRCPQFRVRGKRVFYPRSTAWTWWTAIQAGKGGNAAEVKAAVADLAAEFGVYEAR